MAFEAEFRGGTPHWIDHTPSGAIAAGEVVIVDGRARIAHRAIASGELGSLAAGGGTYRLLKDGTSGPDIAIGDEVFWIAGSDLATNVASGNVHVGQAIAAAGASVAYVDVYHDPDGDST